MTYYAVTPDDADPATGIVDVFRCSDISDVLEYVETLAREYGYYGAVDIDGQIILADCSSHVLDCEYGTALTVPCPGHRIGTVQLLDVEA
jgi:hypothetical protein